MPALANSRHEAFAQALARSLSISAAYVEAGYKPNRGNAHTLLKQNQGISKRVEEIQAEQLAIHQQATAEAVASAKVSIESLIAEAEQARVKAMSERGGAAAAVSAVTVKAKLARVWIDKLDQHTTGSIQYERIERVIVEHTSENAADAKAESENSCEQPSPKPRYWSA